MSIDNPLELQPYQQEILQRVPEMEGVPIFLSTPSHNADVVSRTRGQAIHIAITDDLDYPTGFKEALQEIKSINGVPVVILDSSDYNPYCSSLSEGLVYALKSLYEERQRAQEIFLNQKAEPEWQKLNRGRKRFI